jgi:streptomycin 6-kinase
MPQRILRMFNADRRHIHHILVTRYGSAAKTILSIWLVTLVFATAAVMTAVDELKRYGYAAAAIGVLAMVFLRYRPQRPPTPEATPPDDRVRV